MVFILAIVTGRNPFAMMGMETPQIYVWALQNKVYACMMLFFLSNMVEGQLLSTGAFEVSINDIPVWSKLDTGRIPEPPEMFQIIDGHLKLSSYGTEVGGMGNQGHSFDSGTKNGFDFEAMDA